MKKVAVTVAVLALGLAACAKSNDADNMAANDVNTENAADADMNAAAPENAADNALENLGNAADNAANAVDNAADNATNQ